MAYPTVSAPYGLKPVNLIGGQVYTGSTRNMPVQYGYAANIFYGDPVVLTAGYVTLPTLPVNSTNVIVGYFAGCSYTNSVTKQKTFSQYYPTGTLAGDIQAIVVDDPDVLLQVAATTTATGAVIGSFSSILVGSNVVGGTQTGSTSTGNSGLSVVPTSTAGATTAGFRVIRLVPESQITFGGTSNAAYAATATTVVINGLSAGTFVPVGTDLFNVVGGQLQFVATVATAVASVTATAQSFTTTSTAVAIPSGGTLALVQTPEAVVKTNFGVHRYNLA
jgi:hypothetical protein